MNPYDKGINTPKTSCLFPAFYFSDFLSGWHSIQYVCLRPYTQTNEVLALSVPRLATVYGPSVAAILVTWATAGTKGIRNLLVRLIPAGHHLFYMLFIPVLCTGLTFVAYYLAGLPIEWILQFLQKSWGLLLFQLAVQFLIVGVGEEPGWRGWLLPHVSEKYPLPLAIGLVTLVWAVWHLPILFSGFARVYPWLILLVSVSILFSWLWLKVKGNLFVLALAHACVNAPQAFLENRIRETPLAERYLTNGWEILGYAYLLVALAVVIFDYKYLVSSVHRFWIIQENEKNEQETH